MITRTLDHITRDAKRLEGVHPTLIGVVMSILDAKDILGFPMFVTEGVRTAERQQSLFAQGRTTPGRIVTNADGVKKKSNHQVKADGFGHAVDLAYIDDPATPQQETYDPTRPWELMGLMAEKLGMRWGGRIVTNTLSGDRPHIEYVEPD